MLRILEFSLFTEVPWHPNGLAFKGQAAQEPLDN